MNTFIHVDVLLYPHSFILFDHILNVNYNQCCLTTDWRTCCSPAFCVNDMGFIPTTEIIEIICLCDEKTIFQCLNKLYHDFILNVRYVILGLDCDMPNVLIYLQDLKCLPIVVDKFK